MSATCEGGVTEVEMSRREWAYNELRRRVMVGEFGVRTRLMEKHLAEDLGVSRTPVREALVRLETDRLVVREDGCYYVAVPDLSHLRDLYELRITLELRGLTRVQESDLVSHDVALLEPLRDKWRELIDDLPEPDPQFVLLDEDFHVTLLRASGNDELTEALETVNARIRHVRMYDFLTADRIATSSDEHLRIVELVLAKDLDDALTALHKHVGESLEIVERRAARAITQMALHRRVAT
ncbi:GntR family transcriptional regulator [Nonomuraea rosea]|uniref:GntR family transcriptional regulator n=1 Tax=Nonomuraea rosea TaxID=638574 RepID=A0ABP6Y9C3_9ACTN